MWLIILAVLIIVLIALGGVVYYMNMQTKDEIAKVVGQGIIKGDLLPAKLTPEEDAALNAGIEKGFAIAAAEEEAHKPSPTPTAASPEPPAPKTGIEGAADKAKEMLKPENVAKMVMANKEAIIGGILKSVLKKLIKKAANGTLKKVMAKFVGKLASTILKKLGQKLGVKLLSRIGVKIATKMATTAAMSAATGPAAPFVQAGLMCFDILSLGLDLGDAGGYGKMGTIKEYTKMRDGIYKEMKAAYEKEGAPFPSEVGPLDKLAEDDLSKRLDTEITKLMSVPENIYMKPLFDEMDRYATANPNATEEQIEKYMESKMSLVREDEAARDAMKNICVSIGGVMRGDICGYATKEQCDQSYSWPNMKEEDTYAEWKDGKCLTASMAMRSICTSNHLPYDDQTGLCVVDEKYCRMKGADWEYDDDLKRHDCKIKPGQKVLEAILGETITKGLRQLFDPKQYEPCRAGETDDGYFCRNVNCPPDKDQDAGLCYKKCDTGYKGVGPVCWQSCPDNFTDDGAFCRRAGYCPPDTDKNGSLCYPKCKPGHKGVGPVCWEDCPAGFTDDGTFCRRAGYCPPGTERNGALCYPKCNPDHTGSGPLCIKQCPPGFEDQGLFCKKPGSYGRGVGRIPDVSCPGGWNKRGIGAASWCDRYKFPLVHTTSSTKSCREDEEMDGGLCYKKCKSGYHKVGCCVCSPDCPSGFADIGVSCTKPSYGRGAGSPDTIIQAKKSYGRGAGSPDTTINAKKSYGRGVGSPAVHIRPKKRVIPFSTKDN